MTNDWQEIELLETKMVASDIKSLIFKLKDPIKFEAGQYVTIKTTSVSGYSAQRDYSIASSPGQKELIEFGIQLLDDGEVSPQLFKLKTKDKIQIKGPNGNFYLQKKLNKHPLLLIAGGSGVVPMRSIILANINKNPLRNIVLFVSSKSFEKIAYKNELEQLQNKHQNFKIIYTLTQQKEINSLTNNRRIDPQMVSLLFNQYKQMNPTIFICGPSTFVEAASVAFIISGFNPTNIKSERFG